MKAVENPVCPVVTTTDEICRLFVDNAHGSMCVVQKGHICFSNPGALEITGFSRRELHGAPLTRIIHPRDRKLVHRRHLLFMAGSGTVKGTCNHRIVDRSGRVRWLEVKAIRIIWQGEPAALLLAGDVSAMKKVREDLRKSERELRETVIMLKHKEKEALLKSSHIETMKRAHRWMNSYRDDAVTEVGKNVLLNVHENIFPLLRQIQLHNGDDRTNSLVDLVRINLCEIISPFTKNISLNRYTLTKQERQVAILILQGFKTLEIAQRLGLSRRSVEYHRYKIRSKLGLCHTKTNLRTMLLSLGRE
ncbi:MAG: PAS domain S-box protein [Syntrophales bacterium]|nr:PAS domain S-box protein [Syntrophales bacterium]MCK9528875.1 PAS domain S-box protein [Syntrophales bacterium]MDX9921151.1 PAS domain S-box protein [Syntrophales bacterium]